MPDYKKVCWFCGSTNMKPVETWYQCQDCGATHTELRVGGFSPVTEGDSDTGGSPRAGRPTDFRPSGHATRAAARARTPRTAPDNDNGPSKKSRSRSKGS